MEDSEKLKRLNDLIGHPVVTRDGKLRNLSRIYQYNKSMYAELNGELPTINCPVNFLSIWNEL